MHMPTFLLRTYSLAEPVLLVWHEYIRKTNSKLQFTSSVIMLHSLLQLLFITICNCKYVTHCFYCNCCCFCLSIEYVCVKFIRHIPKKSTVHVLFFINFKKYLIHYLFIINLETKFCIFSSTIVTAIRMKTK
jgi:hypothetical protein